jgi:hypothetical protein
MLWICSTGAVPNNPHCYSSARTVSSCPADWSGLNVLILHFTFDWMIILLARFQSSSSCVMPSHAWLITRGHLSTHHSGPCTFPAVSLPVWVWHPSGSFAEFTYLFACVTTIFTSLSLFCHLWSPGITSSMKLRWAVNSSQSLASSPTLLSSNLPFAYDKG